MTVHGLQTKMAEVHRAARDAIHDRLQGTGYDMNKCLIDIWAEPDGVIVLHLNSGGNASAVTHALWHRHNVESALHPEYGVLVWVA